MSANTLFHDLVLLSHRSMLPKYLLQLLLKMYCTIVLNDTFQSMTVTLALHLQKNPIFSYSPFSRGWAKTPNMGRLMLRASLVSGYDMNLQIKDVYGNGWRDIELRTLRAKENISATGRMWAQEFIPNSSRTLKTDIEDLPFSALDKINSVNIKQYHFIRDVERFESGESITLPINYGMIAEDSDDVFTTPQKDAVTLYSSVAISIQAIQEVDFKVKNLQFDHGMWKQEVDTLKEKLEAEKLEKVSMKAEIYELKVLVQQLINEKPEQP